MTTTSHDAHLLARHRHTTACWFDHRQAAWVCGSPSGTRPHVAPIDAARAADTPADGAPATEETLVDIRDMLVVHTAMLREFRLLIGAVGAVPDGDRRRATRVDRHLRLVCDLLHHHHEGEDAVLWPVLEPRLPEPARAALAAVEAQHSGLDAALEQVAAARTAWVEEPDEVRRDALGETLSTLHVLLAEHLDSEERDLLPLAAALLTEAEWAAVGAAGAASVPKTQMLLVLGMFAYEGDPAVLADMLRSAPAPVRRLVPALGARVYARRAAQVYATSRP